MSVLLGLTVAVSAADTEIHEKVLRSREITIVISNNEMKDIMKTVKSLEIPTYQ